MKALIHIVPRSGTDVAFAARFATLTAELREQAEPRELAVNAMLRLEEDPFGAHAPYAAALEITGAGSAPEPMAPLLSGLGAQLDAFAHPDASTLLVGEDVVFVPSERTPVRYQYLMRRNGQFSHETYLKRYREIHSQFGLRTPGILGYVQFHVDREASRQLAATAALGVWGVDSVSELHLESIETFIREITGAQVGAEAIADEEIFVDRAHSHDFCASVDWSPRFS